MKVSKHLDWLSITIADGLKWRNLLHPIRFQADGRGRHGYAARYRDAISGITVETDALDNNIGTHFTIGGVGIEFIHDNLGWSDDDIVQKLLAWGAKCSRVDLAIDVFGATFTPRDLNGALLEHSAHLPARTWRFIDGHSSGVNGATVDTGSTTSDKRFRFYDKRAEQKIKDGEAWVRLELQLRRLYAKSTVVSCGRYGADATIANSIGSYLTWENTEYHAALIGDYADIPTIPRKDTNRRKWLLGQVAMALASEIRDDPTFRERFDLSVNAFIEKLDNQNK